MNGVFAKSTVLALAPRKSNGFLVFDTLGAFESLPPVKSTDDGLEFVNVKLNEGDGDELLFPILKLNGVFDPPCALLFDEFPKSNGFLAGVLF